MSHPTDPYRCFQCNRQISDGQAHIHVPLDEWSAIEGLPTFGLDDLLTFPFCEPCTVKTNKPGWQLEAHAIASPHDPDPQETP